MLTCESCKKPFDMKTQTKFNIFRACKESKICEDCYSQLGYRMNKQKYLELFDEESIKPYLVENPVTLENMSRKYPRAEAEERYKIYAEKQRIKNTYEFKKQKYGWTEEQFKAFNKSRSVTLENCIKKHGKEKGTQIFNDYCEKQRDSGCSLEFFINKYGVNKGTEKFKEVCSSKAHTLDNYIKRLGDEEGYQKFCEYLESREVSRFYRSNKADDLCEALRFVDKGDIRCIENEYNIIYSGSRFFSYDYTNLTKMKIIEFNGDFWHANPKKYTNEAEILFEGKSVKDIWERDKIKLELARSKGFDVMVVWENEWDNDSAETFLRILEFLDIKETK